MSLQVRNEMTPANQPAVFGRNGLSFYPSGKEMAELVETTKILGTCPYYQKMGPGGVLAIWLTAREMGLPPMVCLNGGMYTFSGAVSLSAQLMNTMIVSAGHRVDILKLDENTCTLRFWRYDRPKDNCTFEFSYTHEMAQTAGLINKANWKTNKRDMLFNRCLSGGARKFMPDAIMGAYAHGELPGDDNYHDVLPDDLKMPAPLNLDYLKPPKISNEQVEELLTLAEQCNREAHDNMYLYINKEIGVQKLQDVPASQYEIIKKKLLRSIEKANKPEVQEVASG